MENDSIFFSTIMILKSLFFYGIQKITNQNMRSNKAGFSTDLDSLNLKIFISKIYRYLLL